MDQYFPSGIYAHKRFAISVFGCVVPVELQGFIRTEPFDPKAWPIPCDYSLPLNLDLETLSPTSKIYSMGKRNIKGKRVADVAEALIGAYVSTAGEQAALSFMTWLGLEIQFVKVPRTRHFLVNAEKFVNVHHFESLLKYKFSDPSLLVEALTHGSFMLSEIPLCYQVISITRVPRFGSYVL